jgi:hypothetical protein
MREMEGTPALLICVTILNLDHWLNEGVMSMDVFVHNVLYALLLIDDGNSWSNGGMNLLSYIFYTHHQQQQTPQSAF